MPSDPSSEPRRSPTSLPSRADASAEEVLLLDPLPLTKTQRRLLYRDLYKLTEYKEWQALTRILLEKRAGMARTLYRTEGRTAEFRDRLSGQIVFTDWILGLATEAQEKYLKLQEAAEREKVDAARAKKAASRRTPRTA